MSATLQCYFFERRQIFYGFLDESSLGLGGSRTVIVSLSTMFEVCCECV